jgi:hypothetical protein
MQTADEDSLAAIRDDLIAGRIGAAARLFRQHGVGTPIVIWDPDPHAVPTPQLSFLLRHWEKLRAADGHVAPARIDLADLAPAIDHVMLLDVERVGADFHYRFYGRAIAARSGFDMTGRRTSEIPTGRLASDFFLAVYRAVLARRLPVYTWHQMPVQVTMNTWHRLILPLSDEEGRVVQLLAGNVGTDLDRDG